MYLPMFAMLSVSTSALSVSDAAPPQEKAPLPLRQVPLGASLKAEQDSSMEQKAPQATKDLPERTKSKKVAIFDF